MYAEQGVTVLQWLEMKLTPSENFYHVLVQFKWKIFKIFSCIEIITLLEFFLFYHVLVQIKIYIALR